MELKNNSIILYDGYCNLCNFSLQFILKRDKKDFFKYYPLDSKEAKDLLSAKYILGDIPDSVILIDGGKLYSKSEAFFKILPHLGAGYKLLLVFKIIPRKLSDKIYDWIAKNRYRWFGKKSECIIPKRNNSAD